MANNRLFIRNRITGEFIGFLKSFGEGWEIRKTAEEIEEHVAELFDDASFGNCYNTSTDLELVSENYPRYTYVEGLLVEVEGKAVIDWKSLITGKVGQGQPMPKTCAIEHAILANKELPKILHWVVDA